MGNIGISLDFMIYGLEYYIIINAQHIKMNIFDVEERGDGHINNKVKPIDTATANSAACSYTTYCA